MTSVNRITAWSPDVRRVRVERPDALTEAALATFDRTVLIARFEALAGGWNDG